MRRALTRLLHVVATAPVTVVLTDGDKSTDTDIRLDVLFDRLLLNDLRQMIDSFDAAEFTALTQLVEPPEPILRVLKAVVLLVKPELSTGERLSAEWSQWLTVRCLCSSNSSKRLIPASLMIDW